MHEESPTHKQLPSPSVIPTHATPLPTGRSWTPPGDTHTRPGKHLQGPQVFQPLASRFLWLCQGCKEPRQAQMPHILRTEHSSLALALFPFLQHSINPFLLPQPADRLMPLFDFYFPSGESRVVRGQGSTGGSGLSRLWCVVSAQLNPNAWDCISPSWTTASPSPPPAACHGGKLTSTRGERCFPQTATSCEHCQEKLSSWRA